MGLDLTQYQEIEIVTLSRGLAYPLAKVLQDHLHNEYKSGRTELITLEYSIAREHNSTKIEEKALVITGKPKNTKDIG